MDDLIREFVVETIENLDVVDAELVRFEREPGNQALLAQIFRLVHTIKGTCGFLSLPRLEQMSHAAEGLIGLFREGGHPSPEEVTLVLAAIDRIKHIVLAIGETGREPDGDDADLVEELSHFARRPRGQDRRPGQAEGTLVYQVLARPLRADEVPLDELEQVFRDTPGPQESRQGPLPDVVVPDLKSQPATQAKPKSVRVAVDRLDHLMNMVSELVLVRNQLLDVARRDDAGGFKLPLQRLSHITGELQDGVMRTRMQAIGAAWSNMPRIARDLSVELGKQINVEMSGADTEIDRQLLEVIKDCIVHIVRNAADHGLETPEERIASDKSAHGTIRLRASQQAGHIMVEVTDDGRGIDLIRVRERAYLLGLIDDEERLRLSDSDAARLIFAPGFSTASQVTNLSGRGVGLDAVRANIEQVGGTVEVTSRAGLGSSIILKLPLTLAIAAVLIVEADGQKFALPQIVIGELVRAQPGTDIRIEQINGTPTLRMRSDLLPVIDLSTALGTSRPETVSSGFVVICQFGQQRFGLAVDAIHQTEEIVVKPISAKLRHVPYFSGATILGDGSVILILEPSGFARMADEFGSQDPGESADDAASVPVAEKTSLLVFRAGPGNLKVVPLALIGRLEDVDAGEIVQAGGHAVLKYQGKLMPLQPATPDTGAPANGRQPLLVFSHGGHNVGVMVDEIVDVIEAELNIDLRHECPGFVGSAIIHDQAMDVFDVAQLFARLEQAEPGARHRSRRPPGVLLVERSEFFRAMLAPLIRGCGYVVGVAESPEKARAMAHQGDFDVVVLDLDDASGEGFGLAEDLASDPLTGDPRVIGLATRNGSQMNRRAAEAGLEAVVGKFDRQSLLRIISETFNASETAA